MALVIRECPSCHTRVIPMADGTCPSCRRRTFGEREGNGGAGVTGTTAEESPSDGNQPAGTQVGHQEESRQGGEPAPFAKRASVNTMQGMVLLPLAYACMILFSIGVSRMLGPRPGDEAAWAARVAKGWSELAIGVVVIAFPGAVSGFFFTRVKEAGFGTKLLRVLAAAMLASIPAIIIIGTGFHKEAVYLAIGAYFSAFLATLMALCGQFQPFGECENYWDVFRQLWKH